ncbi:MAG: DeoR/GlpR family DNA-binding transcription regulator [Balneolales bacterium]
MAKYSVAQRRNRTLKLLQEKGLVSVSELGKELEVTEVTIRKDLEYLEDHNLLIRTHGGAMHNGYLVYDQSIEEKGRKYAEEKRAIGRAAAKLVANGDTILMDAGTTVMQVARGLRGKHNLTVLTTAINVALELIKHPDVEVLMIGGTVRLISAAVVGPNAEQMVREHSCRKLFLAVNGFDLDHGITTTNTLEAQLKRVMIDSAQETIVVTDSSKFSQRGLSRICKVEDVDIVITDKNISDNFKKQLEDRGIRVIIA